MKLKHKTNMFISEGRQFFPTQGMNIHPSNG